MARLKKVFLLLLLILSIPFLVRAPKFWDNLNMMGNDLYNATWINSSFFNGTYHGNGNFLTNLTIYNTSYEYWLNDTLMNTYNSSYEYLLNATVWSTYNFSYEYWTNATLMNTFNVSYEYWLNDTLTRTFNSSYLLNIGDTATGNYSFDSGTLFIDATNGRVGIGTTSPEYEFDVDGFTNTKSIHEVSPEGLVLGMNFNSETITGTAGSETVLDSSDYNNHGTNIGATHNETGGFNGGGAFEFDGSNDYVNTGYSGTNLNDSFSIGVWFYVNNMDSSYSLIEQNNVAPRFYIRTAAGTTDLSFGFGDTAFTRTSAYSGAGSWNFLILVFNKSTNIASPFINGVALTPNVVLNFVPDSKNIMLGRAGPSGALYLNGTIDDFRIYNRLLSADEIKALYLQRAEVHDSYVSQKDVYVDSSGNVGIGTTSPIQALNVIGTVNATEFLCAGGACIGGGNITSLAWNKLTGYDLNVGWINTLDWGNLTRWNLDVLWTGKLNSGNITVTTDWADADVSDTLTCSVLTDDNTYALVAGETFAGDIAMGGNSITGATDVNTTNVYADNINSVLYVQAGNATDIQATIVDAPTSTLGAEIHIVDGNYALDRTVNVTSNLTLIIEQGASIYWNAGATPSNFVDALASTYNTMFFGDSIENFKLINNGVLEPTKSTDPANKDTIMLINNSKDIDIVSGHLKSSGEGFGIFNSNNVTVDDVYSDGLTSVPVWFECVKEGHINKVRGSAPEAVDLNADNEEIIVSDVIFKGIASSDEIIDINSGKNILVYGVLAYDANRSIKLSNATAGARFGVCTPLLYSSDITARGISCHNCDNTPQLDAFNYTVEETVSGMTNLYTNSHSVLDGLAYQWSNDDIYAAYGFGRSNSERLKIRVGDADLFMTYQQDSDGDTAHYWYFQINATSDGANGYYWATNDSQRMFLNNTFLWTNTSTVLINTTIPDSTQNNALEVNGRLGLTDFISHVGDSNTFISFTDDYIALRAGGNYMIQASEGADDVVTIQDYVRFINSANVPPLTPVEGMCYWNTTVNYDNLQCYDGSNWYEPVKTTGGTMTGDIAMGTNDITNANWVNSTNTNTTSFWADLIYEAGTLISSIYCKLTGCTMSGDLDMGSHNITNAGWVNATYTNSTYSYTTVTCYNPSCTRNITDNSTNLILYG